MQVTFELPDELIEDLVPVGQDVARSVREDALVEAYREKRISGRQLMTALGIPTRYELDGFLKSREVWIELSPHQVVADEAYQEAFVAAWKMNTAQG